MPAWRSCRAYRHGNTALAVAYESINGRSRLSHPWYDSHAAPMPAIQPAIDLRADPVLTVLPTLSAYFAGVAFHFGDDVDAMTALPRNHSVLQDINHA